MVSMRGIMTAVAATLVGVGLSACSSNDAGIPTSPAQGAGIVTGSGTVDMNELIYYHLNPECAGTDPKTLKCVVPIREGLRVTKRDVVHWVESAEERRQMIMSFPQYHEDSSLVVFDQPNTIPLPFICPTNVDGCNDVKKGDVVSIVAVYKRHTSAHSGDPNLVEMFVERIVIE